MRKKLSLLLAAVLIMQLFAVMPYIALAAEQYVCPASQSDDYNFNIDWRFSKPYGATWPLKDAVDGTKDSSGRSFYEPDFDDSSWQSVSVPHTFNDEDSFRNVSLDAGDGGVYRGIAFYRKEFILPETDNGKKVLIEFEGIRQGSYVYINGELAGFYEMGVTPFGIDLTKYVKFGEKNILAVAVDNTSSRGMSEIIAETRPGSVPGSNDGDTFQWNTKDFNPVMGGITRNVILHVKSAAYITLPLYSNLRTKGVYVYADNFDISAKTANIHVEAEIRNESGGEAALSIETVVVDKDGNIVEQAASEPVTVAAAADTEKNYDLSIVPADAYEEEPKPTDTESLETTVIKTDMSATGLRFWSPDDPYLYDVYVVLKNGDEVLDSEKISTGFRKAEMRGGKDGGAFINDTFYFLTGYAQRSTNEWAAIGVANDWLKDYDAQLIRESNANFVRWMHIAAQPADIRSFDKYGIVCVQPAGDKEGDVSGRQWDQRVEVMRDTLIYFRNSPSIIFWESGNAEISTEHMREMTQLRKELDPYGMRYMGSRSIVSPETVVESEYVGTMLGRNVWNGKEFTEDGAAARDARPVVETEYHREEAPRRVWDDYSPPDFDYKNVFSGGSKISYKDAYDLTAEDFVLSDAQSFYEYYKSRMQANSETPYYTAIAALCWSDSDQHGRQQATENARMSGRVDPVRIKKQSFYAYQTMQSNEPSLYVVGHWNYPTDINEYIYEEKNDAYEYTSKTALRDAKNKTVYVIASNVESVKLFVNGAEKGECREPQNGFVYAFDGIDITEHGYIEAVGYNGATVAVRSRIDTAGDAAQMKLTPVTGPEGWIADGTDIAYIDVEVMDEDGNICPLDYDRIDFEVSGPAVMLGGYNSGVTDLNHSNNYAYAECGTNRIFLRSTREAGEVTVTAKRAGMPNVSVKLNTKEFMTENGLSKIMPQVGQPGAVKPQQIASPKISMDTLAKPFTIKFGDNTAIKQQNSIGNNIISIIVNGSAIECDAYKMVGVYGEIMPVLDSIGAKYNYDENEKRLTAEYNGTVISTQVKNSEMTVNGEPGIINDWPELIDGKLYAEISAIAANFGLNVKESEGRYEIWK